MELSDRERFVPCARDFCALLEELPFPWAIVGGVAFGINALPRATKDIDAIVIDERGRAEEIAKAAEGFGFEPLSESSIAMAKRTRVLQLRHIASGVPTDILLGLFPFEKRVVDRAKSHEFQGIDFRIATAEDLIILKAFAGRERDLRDIADMLEIRADLDYDYVEKHTRELARQLESPEIWTRVEEMKFWRRPE